MTELDGLKYALDIIQHRRVGNKNEAYLAALDDMETFIKAAIERVENGEEMRSTATFND